MEPEDVFDRLFYLLAEDGVTPICVDAATWTQQSDVAMPHVGLHAITLSGAIDPLVQWNVERVDRSALAIVSTIFLGLDHGGLDGVPLLWESMVFVLVAGDPGTDYVPHQSQHYHGTYQMRYSSHQEAAATHAAICRAIAEYAAPWRLMGDTPEAQWSWLFEALERSDERIAAAIAGVLAQ